MLFPPARAQHAALEAGDTGGVKPDLAQHFALVVQALALAGLAGVGLQRHGHHPSAPTAMAAFARAGTNSFLPAA